MENRHQDALRRIHQADDGLQRDGREPEDFLLRHAGAGRRMVLHPRWDPSWAVPSEHTIDDLGELGFLRVAPSADKTRRFALTMQGRATAVELAEGVVAPTATGAGGDGARRRGPLHVRVSTSEPARLADGTHEAFAFHVSEVEVRARFVEPWRERAEIVCDGLVFAPDRVRVQIVEGSTYSSQPFSGSPDWRYVQREGRNATDTLLGSRSAPEVARDVAPSPRAPGTVEDPRRVMVVHGRDERARRAPFEFLRAVKLDPIEWTEAVGASGSAAPYNAEAVDAAFAMAQAAVVLCTPDEHVLLREDLRDGDDPDEARAAWQPRPNVYFEGGIAFTRHPDRTIVIELGRIRAASDLAGRNVVRIGTEATWRHSLVERLRDAGCPAQTSGTDWLAAGEFPPLPTDPETASLVGP